MCIRDSGNALDVDSVRSNSGFYDSNTGTIRWEISNNPNFAVIQPGATRNLDFTIEQGSTLSTSAFDLTVNVFARRVAESSATEQLIGTIKKQGKYSSSVLLGSQIGYGGIFTNSGPIPPVVGQTTSYTATIVAEAGANDLEDVVANTSLPIHVTWLEQHQGDGTLIYNNVSKQIEWQVGTIDSNVRKEISFTVSILPSISQLGITPVLVNKQELVAEDRFTGDTLRETAGQITTELSTEAGHPSGNGVVVEN